MCIHVYTSFIEVYVTKLKIPQLYICIFNCCRTSHLVVYSVMVDTEGIEVETAFLCFKHHCPRYPQNCVLMHTYEFL